MLAWAAMYATGQKFPTNGAAYEFGFKFVSQFESWRLD